MLNIKSVLFFISTLIMSGCSTCNLEVGQYESAGGSEYTTRISLTNDNQYTFETENWRPGEYENRTIATKFGSWSCKNNTITLSDNSNEISAKIGTIGENPLQLPPNTQALHFDSTAENTWSVLNREILYKQ